MRQLLARLKILKNWSGATTPALAWSCQRRTIQQRRCLVTGSTGSPMQRPLRTCTSTSREPAKMKMVSSKPAEAASC